MVRLLPIVVGNAMFHHASISPILAILTKQVVVIWWKERVWLHHIAPSFLNHKSVDCAHLKYHQPCCWFIFAKEFLQVSTKNPQCLKNSLPIPQPKKGWHRFLTSLGFEQPLEFNEGDIGLPGAKLISGLVLWLLDAVRLVLVSTYPKPFASSCCLMDFVGKVPTSSHLGLAC